MKLFDIAAEYRDTAAKLADLDLDEQTIADTLEGMSGDLSVKLQNIAFIEQEARATAEAIDKALKAMQARKKAVEQQADKLLAYMQAGMEAAGVSKITAPHFELALVKNPASVDVFEPGLIPAEYMRQPEPPPPAPDKTRIKDAPKAGADVPGCRLVAGQRLRIK